MKTKILIITIFFPLTVFAQKAINLTYSYPKKQETRVYNELNDIITLSLLCKDKNAKGKKFLIKRETFVNGKMIQSDSIFSCENRIFPVISNNDTLKYKVNYCDRTKFIESEKNHKIVFGGKFKNDSVQTIVNYPSISTGDILKANKNYIFKSLQKTDDNSNFKIQTSKDYPIIALTPPLKAQGGFSSYCLINSQEPRNFYKEYKIKRYYIYYLKVE